MISQERVKSIREQMADERKRIVAEKRRLGIKTNFGSRGRHVKQQAAYAKAIHQAMRTELFCGVYDRILILMLKDALVDLTRNPNTPLVRSELKGLVEQLHKCLKKRTVDDLLMKLV